MHEHSRKLERVEEARKLRTPRGLDGERLDELPISLIRSGSFILNILPNTLISIANIKAILVNVLLYALNELLINPFLDKNECCCE